MEVTEESAAGAAPAIAHDSTTSGLRLRPLKTTTQQGEKSPGKSVQHPIPITSYLEETWEDEPMTPAGRVFTEMNATFVCVCILGFKYPIDRQKFKSHLELTLMKHKRFSSRVETRKGRPWWTQVKTNVNDHVFEADLTQEERENRDCVLNYTTDVVLPKPFDESRPLWDMHLVDAKLGEAEGCCIVRLHHSLGDGTSLISLLMACTRSIDKPDKLPSVTTASQKRKAALPQAATSSVVSRLSSAVWKYLLVCWCSLIEIAKAGATLIWLKDSPTMIKGYSGIEDAPRKYRFVTLRLEDFKFVSKTLGVTINDVFMAIAARGLRQYLEHHAQKDVTAKESNSTTEQQVHEGEIRGEEVKNRVSKRLEKDGLPKRLDKLRVRAVALMNMRASPGLQELSEMMNGNVSQARWGNHMGYLLLSLPMKQYSDPLKLLQRVKAIGTSKKSSLEGAFSYAFGVLLMKLFGQKAAAAVVYRATMQTTISLSNVRGPTEHVELATNPILHIIPSVVGHPHSLVLHLQSYDEEVAIVAMSSKKLIPDTEYLLELCIDGLEELKKAAIEHAQRK